MLGKFFSWLFGLFKKTTPRGGGKRRSLHVGVNNFPGTQNDLRGCVNDARDIQDVAKKLGFRTKSLLNKKATPERTMKLVRRMIRKLKPGDIGVWSFSSHGTYVVDSGNDEPDSKDECVFLYGKTFETSILRDDVIRKALRKLKPGVHFFIIADTCHSGTITRGLLPMGLASSFTRKKFAPPPEDMLRKGENLESKHKLACPEEDMNYVLLTGCQSHEYSYDSYFGGRPNGALTHTFLSAFKDLGPDATYNQIYKKIRSTLPSSNFPQTPQLEASQAIKKQTVFGGTKRKKVMHINSLSNGAL